ncbi:MAG: DUF6209 family protein [Rhodospirillales bacterium]
MRRKLRDGKPAEVTFTCDFHQLPAGDLRPGASLLLRYDPQRIVPADEPYRFGDPGRPVIAHLRFRADAPDTEVPLQSPAGTIACPDVDPTGQGSMLSARIAIPADADRLIVWFSFVRQMGETIYDSNLGANYRFGFPAREIIRIEATVERRPDAPSDRFEVAITAVERIDAVTVSYVLAADPACAKRELPLQRADETAEETAHGQNLWRGDDDVPHGAIVRFKLRYRIDGCQCIDDDAGAHYLAPAPGTVRPPAPPMALVEAAATWR